MSRKGRVKVIVIGDLGADPEVKTTKDGVLRAQVSVAENESWTDKRGDTREHTEWHRVVFFGRLAEVAEKYLKKGSRIYVEGNLKTRKWKDRKGVERYTTEIIAIVLDMLDKRVGDAQTAMSDEEVENLNGSSSYSYNSSAMKYGYTAQAPNA